MSVLVSLVHLETTEEQTHVQRCVFPMRELLGNFTNHCTLNGHFTYTYCNSIQKIKKRLVLKCDLQTLLNFAANLGPVAVVAYFTCKEV